MSFHIINKDVFFALQNAIITETECAIFFMKNAFGFITTETIDQLRERQKMYNSVVNLYGYWHRN